MGFNILVAASDNDIIGNDNKLPWRLSNDLQRFKQLTLNHMVVMGRKTWDSIGRPLPNRISVVLTKQAHIAKVDHIAHNLEDVLKIAEPYDNAFVIGGGEIYDLLLPYVTTIYLTRVHTIVEGDTKLPSINWNDWSLIEQEHHLADQYNDFDYTFEVYQK